MADKRTLEMKFDPNTIEHLGIKMYSRIPTAIAELVANAYDADATEVVVSLYDGENKKVVVEDDGTGMTFDEINSCFLLIGRNRRTGGQNVSTSGSRVVTGKKGLGKLALFGIGDTIEVITKKDGHKVHFRMNWNRLRQTQDANYSPDIISIAKTDEDSGTTITLSDLKRKSPFNERDLAVNLSKLFNFFDDTFRVVVKKGDIEIEVNNELKYANLEAQFEFSFPEHSEKVDLSYEYNKAIKGKIVTTEKPLKPGLRGITLYANGRLVNAPEFFGRSESSHFYSYVTGWLNVDFVDNWDEDVISTNRQSLNWNLDRTEMLRVFLQKILSDVQKDWRKKRITKRKKKLAETTNIDISEWYATLPENIKPTVSSIVDSIEKSQLVTDDQVKAIQGIHELIPEYPYYHWRHLHEEIKDVAENYYKRKDYYGAFTESVKKYINAARQKSGVGHGPTEADLMAKAFHHRSGTLNVAANYNRPNGEEFSPTTLENIQEGHFHFSKGTVQGGRHPVAHEEVNDLRESGLFSEKDCLDLLSLLSHLHNRLDNAEKK